MSEQRQPHVTDPRRFGTAREVVAHCFPAHGLHTACGAQEEAGAGHTTTIAVTCSCGKVLLLAYESGTEAGRLFLADARYGLRNVFPIGRVRA